MTAPVRPVVFIHGLWLHATSWSNWEALFGESGYDPVAPGWPGDADTVDGCRANPAPIAGHGVDDVVNHFAEIIRAMATPPVVIGHSFGGTIVEKLMGMNLAAAGVAIDAAPIKGVLPLPISALRVAFIALHNPANRHRAISLTPEQFRYAFGNAVSEAESDQLFDRWTIPAPGKPLFQAATANFSPHAETKVDTHNATRGPLLLIMGGKDRTVPEAITKSTLKQYAQADAVTDLLEFPDRGHSLTIDSGWRPVADACLAWLTKQGV